MDYKTDFTGWEGYDHIGDRIHAIKARPVIENWCWEHLGKDIPITCTKTMDMVEFWDDRAIQVIKNTGEKQ